jgi:indoleamine 2,3-dioxygenase
LALPPTFSNDERTSLTTESHAGLGSAPNVASLAAADFDVDVRTGFLPPSANVARLPAPYDVWEDALAAASGDGPGRGVRLGGGRPEDEAWRAAVASMPVLDIDGLVTLPLLRRAHSVLAFLCHFYVHTATPKAVPAPTEIPASISVPLLATSPLVGLPPVLTYADTVLWNVQPADLTRCINMSDNPPVKTLCSFTNTKSEDGFWLVSAECEAAGAAALSLMRQSLDELFLGDDLALRRLTVYLRKLADQIDRVGDITLRMMTEVDPEEFYHVLRPWFKGGDAEGPNSPGWIFLGVDDDLLIEAENRIGSSAGRKFSGPSAGQSSLVHAFDVFLTVDHAPRQDEDAQTVSGEGVQPDSAPITLNHNPIHPEAPADGSTPAEQPRVVEATYLQRMLQYMPLPHRTFLMHLASHPTPLRSVVLARQDTHPALADAYDGALAALRRFRDKHMRVVSRHIVQQARRAPSPRVLALLGRASDEPAVTAPPKAGVDDDGLRGTGGTPLVRFLKRCRDNTSRAMVVDEKA